MRKGARRVEWTTSDLDYLRANAGILPPREICRELKRSRKSVERMAARLGVSLRAHVSDLEWCAECAAWRSTVSPRDGRCDVCRMRASLERAERRAARALRALTPDERESYMATEPRRRSKPPPRPRMPASSPMSRYQRAKAADLHAREMERWETACLEQRAAAARKRLERMREKAGANPRKKTKSMGVSDETPGEERSEEETCD